MSAKERKPKKSGKPIIQKQAEQKKDQDVIKKKRVLIIDDDETIFDGLYASKSSENFNREAFDFDYCCCLKVAFNKITTSEQYDYVIIDIQFPEEICINKECKQKQDVREPRREGMQFIGEAEDGRNVMYGKIRDNSVIVISGYREDLVINDFPRFNLRRLVKCFLHKVPYSIFFSALKRAISNH